MLQGYAADTWRSFELLLDPTTGLPSDNVSAAGVRSRFTSPTNVGAYLWSTLAARDAGIISPSEARQRIAATLASVARLERHQPSGMFYNWYDPATGAKLTTWPVDGSPVYPFLSSVDNGWMAAALLMVSNAVPELRDQARALLAPMDFGYYYDPAAGLLRGGFWVDPPGTQCTIAGNYRGDVPDVLYTCHHYGALNTEPRIASYLGIAFGQVPATHYFRMSRTFPPTCDWGWQEQQPAGVTRTYLGVEVFEGHYRYRGMDLVPSWGGHVRGPDGAAAGPRGRLGAAQLGREPPAVRPRPDRTRPRGGRLRLLGLLALQQPLGRLPRVRGRRHRPQPRRLRLQQRQHPGRLRLRGLPTGPAGPGPEAYTNGVVTPHASFLALPYARRAALDNLDRLRRDFEAYGEGGFYDAVNVDTGQVSRYWLALDQGMIMAAIANELTGDRLQRYFTRGAVEEAIRPLLAMEEFTAGG